MPRIKNEYTFTWNIGNDEKTIVCIATPARYDDKFIEAINSYRRMTGRFPQSYKNDFAFTGKAILKDNDLHDLELAQKIARAKALRQANGIMAKIMKEVADCFYKGYAIYADISFGTKEESLRQDEKIVYWTNKSS